MPIFSAKNPSYSGGNGQGGTKAMEYAVMVEIGKTQDKPGQEIGIGQVSQENKKKRVSPLVFEKQAGAGLGKCNPGQRMSDR